MNREAATTEPSRTAPAAQQTAKAVPGAGRMVWFNGRLQPGDQAAVSVYDHGVLYGDGVFEGIRAYGGRVLKLLTHLRRLFESALHIDLKIPYSIEELDRAVRQTVAANNLPDGYIRLCVTRGAGTLGLNPYQCPTPNVFIIVDTITLYPAEMYERGMAIVTAATMRNHPAALSPRVKSLNYLNNIMAKIEAIRAKTPEAVMLNHLGYVAECTGDNVFIVRKGHDGKARLATPPLHAGILEGVTRNLVIDLARASGIQVDETDLTRHDLVAADEVFLTGTAAEVIAVTQIDGRQIGDGVPGEVTRRIVGDFRRLLKNAPED